MTTDTPRTDAEVFEIQDCNGQLRKVITTQFARQLERELAHSLENQVKSQAEVEMFRKDNAALTYIGANLESHNWNLKRELESTEEALQQMTEDAVNLKVEVDRLKKRPFGCKCQNFREKVLGDGCDECNKALVIEIITDERDELEAEVERLETQLAKAHEELCQAGLREYGN